MSIESDFDRGHAAGYARAKYDFGVALRSPAQGMYSVEDITGWTDSLSGKTPSAWIDDPIVGIAAWKAAQLAGKDKQPLPDHGMAHGQE